jgi:molybdate transport system ATP-binding protein
MTASDEVISLSLRGKLGAFGLDVDFTVPARGVTALFGPSGCGKTTILRCLAGLEKLSGRVSVGSDIWQDLRPGAFRPPHARHVGYVFQEANLFPHLSVRENLLYGARRVRGAVDSGRDLSDIAALLGIGHLLDRSTTALSGGERQRVAVGRALLSRPRVLLMDEPLAALDRPTKDEILPYFEMLHEQLALPIIYVTHDFTEIERLADTLVLIEAGRVRASGPLRDLQTDPSLPLLRAPEATVVLDGTIAAFDHPFGLTEMSVGGSKLVVPGRHGAVGDKRRVRIHASDVSLTRSAPAETTILNCLSVRIVAVDERADDPQAILILALGSDGSGSHIAARITRKSLVGLALEPGQQVFAQIKSVALIASRSSQPDA